MKKLTALLLLLPVLASADPEPWMKKAKNPNELVLLFGSNSECPFSIESGRGIVADILTRARIKPSERELGVAYYPPFLQVLIHCSKLQSDRYMFEITIDFIGVAKAHDDEQYTVRWGDSSRGSSGLSAARTLRDTLKSNVEDVIADYLKANFDLGGSHE